MSYGAPTEKQRATASWAVERLEVMAGEASEERWALRLREMAAWIRKTGVVTGRMFSVAAHGIKECGVCGGVAIYRSGKNGACRKHKDSLTGLAFYCRERERRAAESESEANARDSRLRKQTSATKLARSMLHRGFK
jgi:hypothetical protein